MRQYAIGTLALSTATQAGLASTLSGLAGVRAGPATGWPSTRHGCHADRVDRSARPRPDSSRRRGCRPSVRRRCRRDRRPARPPRARSSGERSRMAHRAAAAARGRYDRAAPTATTTPGSPRPGAARGCWLLAPKSATPVGRTDVARTRLRGLGRASTRRPTRRFLGVADDVPYFAVTVDATAEPTGWQALRESGRELDDLRAGLLVTAVALEQWHRRHTALPAAAARRPQMISAGWTRALPDRRQRPLPAHRPGGDHAGARRRRPVRCSVAGTQWADRAGSRHWPDSWSRGSRSRRRWPARCTRRSASGCTDVRYVGQPAVAVPGVADARFHRPARRRRDADAATRRDGRGRLVHPRGGAPGRGG